GVGGGLRSADAEYYLSMPHGCVTPLAVIFDGHKEVQVIVDTALQNAEYLNIYPGTNEATVGIKPSDLEKYCAAYGNPLQYVDMDNFFGENAKKYLDDAKAASVTQKPKKAASQQPVVKDAKEQKTGSSEQEGITHDKFTEFGEWFKELVIKCELIDYTDISGCYVLRPASYFMWECIKNFMDEEIKKMGVSNTYFPLFVSEDALKSEAKHFEDFSPEVAWVTHSGNTPLEKKLAVRPTSETIMYPMFRRWIRSFRDLPLKINQWCNVVRWEFKNPTPFLRTREFLWQEGHTAHPTMESALKEVYEILDMYARTYRDVCAIPTIKGKKTKGETFPGADLSTTVEAYISGSGRGIQGATSHCLGENFAKMFNIKYLDEKNEPKYVVQNSWGFTTRSIGVMIMSHSDNKGLVLPPRVAQWQVTTDNKQDATNQLCHDFVERLKKVGIKAFVDDRELSFHFAH
ncbi:prolyl-tRNA synthetase, partial [Reticulomyxa filosa]